METKFGFLLGVRLCSFLMLLSHLSALGLVDDFELVAWGDLCT